MAPFVVGHTDPVFRVLRAPGWWKHLLVGALVGLIAGLAWVLVSPKVFEATVAVELSEASARVNLTGSGSQGKGVTVDTDANIVASDAVVGAVARQTGASPSQVRASLSVAARPLTRVMTITYAAGSAGDALRGAQAAATAFLAERNRLIIGPVRSYLTSVRDHPVTAGPATGTDSATVQADLWTMEQRRQAALVKELELAGPGAVLESARITASGRGADIAMPLATGAALGVLVMVGVGVARDHRRSGQAKPVDDRSPSAP